MTRARDTFCTTLLFPREHHTAVTFGPYPPVLGVGTTLSCTKFSPTVSGGEAVASENKQKQHGFVLHCPLVCFAEPASHTGAAASGLGDSTSLPRWLLAATRLRCVRARLNCSWTERRWWPRPGQPGPGKRVTSGSADRSPSPSGCVSSPEPHRSTWPWQPAGWSWSAPWSRGLCSPVGRRASAWVSGGCGAR